MTEDFNSDGTFIEGRACEHCLLLILSGKPYGLTMQLHSLQHNRNTVQVGFPGTEVLKVYNQF